MNEEDFQKFLEEVPPEFLNRVAMSMPWQYGQGSTSEKDPDGFDGSVSGISKDDLFYNSLDHDAIQKECWRKFHRNPQINTSIRGVTGRMVGLGFGFSSDNWKVHQAIEEIELDPRNRLYYYWPKYVARFNIEGEWFTSMTLHDDGFVEIDFIDPSTIRGGGDNDCGILFHSKKKTMPLFYNVTDPESGQIAEQIPSIFIARYPRELIEDAKKHPSFDIGKQESGINGFESVGGYRRFMVAWDKGLITHRAISHMRTTLEWLNHYEDLKKYEIDHKKSSGAYCWVFEPKDMQVFKLWLSLSDEEKRKTGLLSKMTPGSRLIPPPGFTVKAVNPQLTSIRDQDTDILQMVASGLNESEDVMTGSLNATYASAKASRGPMSDRISDEISYFKKFLIHDFWGAVFFLKTAIGKFPSTIPRKECVGFDNKKPIIKTVKRRPEMLIDISFPVSETIDMESRSRALLGVKHGPVAETAGIPNKEVSERLGFGGYGRLRRMKATEDETYPDLVYAVDSETLQENVEGGERKKGKSDDDNDRNDDVKKSSDNKNKKVDKSKDGTK
jgi:hypothetical protein